MTDNDWMQDAPCRGSDTEMFFLESARKTANFNLETRKAINICKSCEFQKICLETFINEQYGIFGGTTPLERQKIRSRRKRGVGV